MQILDVRKIKLFIIVVSIAFIVVLTLSVRKIIANGKTKVPTDESPVLQPAPDNLMNRRRMLNFLQKSKGSFYVDEHGNIIITSDGSKNFRIDKDGIITSFGQDGAESKDISSEDRNFLNDSLTEISEDFMLADPQIENAINYNSKALSSSKTDGNSSNDRNSKNAESPNNVNQSEKAKASGRLVFEASQSAEETAKEAAEGVTSDIQINNQNGKSQNSNNATLPYPSGSSTAETEAKATSLVRIPLRSAANQDKSNSSPRNAANASSEQYDDYISLDTDFLSASLMQNDYEKQNSQEEKRKFLQEFANSNSESHLLTTSDIAPGTIVPITLITGINSDLPGEVIAQTNVNIYDTLTRTKLLIAKGTKLIATYDSRITYGQQRILIAWTTLVRSDGLVVTLPGFQGTDNMGHSGYDGNVDNHFGQIVGTSLLSSMIDIASLGLSDLIGNKTADVVLNTITDSVTTPAVELMQKTINRQPTITIPPGTECKMLINKTLSLPEQGR